MRSALRVWLVFVAFAAGIVLAAASPRIDMIAASSRAELAAALPVTALDQTRDLNACADQTPARAAERIGACTRMIKSGRVTGKPLGIAYGLRGLAYLDRGDIPAAIGDLNRAVDLAPDFAPAYQNRGNAWYARGNYGQAIADYDVAIKIDPNSPSPYLNRATVRRDLGYADGALADYQVAIALGADRAAPFSGRGQIYLRQKDYARAIADFDRAVKIEPAAENYMLRAQARAEAGDIDLALSDYQEAATLDPKNAAALNAQGELLRKKGDVAKAIAVYDRAIAIDEKPALSYRLRAEAELARGDRKQAYADINQALKLAWSVNGLRVRAAIRLEDGNIDGALSDADALLKIEPDNRDGLALRGISYARKKDYAQALSDLDLALNDDGKDAAAYAERGQIYLAKGDTERALADLNRAIESGATGTAVYRARAAIYKAKGETAKAVHPEPKSKPDIAPDVKSTGTTEPAPPRATKATAVQQRALEAEKRHAIRAANNRAAQNRDRKLMAAMERRRAERIYDGRHIVSTDGIRYERAGSPALRRKGGFGEIFND